MRFFSTLSGSAMALILTPTAFAADLYTPPPAPPAPPPIETSAVSAHDWTGFYVGVIAGYGWGDKRAEEIEDRQDGVSYNVDGWFGGIEAGANWQSGHHVFGIEGDIAFADIDGRGLVDDDDPMTTEIDFLATLTGRFGVTHDRALFYVEGGGAWVSESHTFEDDGQTDTQSDDRLGGLIGAGVEYAHSEKWSFKLEYNYIVLGTEEFDFDVGDVETIDIKQDLQTLKVGVNYRY